MNPRSLVLFTALASILATVPLKASPVIEFLWDEESTAKYVRAEALALIVAKAPNSRVCWKSDSLPSETTTVQWRVMDGDGQLIQQRDYQKENDHERMISCSPSMIEADDAEYGMWTYELYFDGELVADQAIEVVENLEDWSRYTHRHFPYVRGRTNFASEYAEQYRGEFRLELVVGPEGSVDEVNLDQAKDATAFAKEIVLASGQLFRFPPGQKRSEKPLRIIQPVNLIPE